MAIRIDYGNGFDDVLQAPSEYVKTTYRNEQQLLNDILFLYNGSNPIDVDVCYSKGSLWGKLPKPTMKFDLEPETEDTIKADMRSLPLGDASVGSLLCDPPFITGMRLDGDTSSSVMLDRLSGFSNTTELKALYGQALQEFKRVVKPNGLILFKCQDITTSNHQFLSHLYVANECQRIGMCVEDVIILVRERAMLDRKNQVHARKTHCYYMVIINAETKKEHWTLSTIK